MKKFLGLSLVFFFALTHIAQAGSRSGLGFEYSGGFIMPLNDYEMRSIQSFAVTVDVTPDLQVGIFRDETTIRGENSYTGEDVTADDIDLTLINTGDLSFSGLRFKHTLPFEAVSMRAGIELGSARFSNSDHTLRETGSDSPPATDTQGWGEEIEEIDGSFPSLGLIADVMLVVQETETLVVSFFASAAYRNISLPDIYSLGETKDSFEDPADHKRIDPLTNFNNLSMSAGINIGF